MLTVKPWSNVGVQDLFRALPEAHELLLEALQYRSARDTQRAVMQVLARRRLSAPHASPSAPVHASLLAACGACGGLLVHFNCVHRMYCLRFWMLKHPALCGTARHPRTTAWSSLLLLPQMEAPHRRFHSRNSEREVSAFTCYIRKVDLQQVSGGRTG
jgi:hypothetical protein